AREKQRRDDIETVELINRGTPTVPVATGGDGGMNPTFLAAVRSNRDPGAVVRTASGTIPAHVNPPEGNGDACLSSARAAPIRSTCVPRRVRADRCRLATCGYLRVSRRPA